MIQGTCQRRKWRRKANQGERIPWDSADKVVIRDPEHAKARLLCASCPALEACENYLADKERAGVSVAGVVAGRYCDLPAARASLLPPKVLPRPEVAEQQSHCRGCGALMWPQCTPPARVAASEAPQHQGEGLCENCYPHLSRTNRNTR
ncbi:hypothetical protein [Corynebacterium sp. CCUG 51687]|uniref:hypothetical protein n=1 Tax=Corynebacterium sp. CCUG 51687 TaxID=2823897 RepID=UPI002109D1A3|nr:hypothetical protein [Corynebacterium sp. CCUG 51687]MCQ4611874.1 hypothetical protein [Corynebacterium sp. CCUG 51687]